MPDTTTGGFGGSSDSSLPIVFFGLALLLGGAVLALFSRRSTSHLTE
jgi:hypothetical protein